MGLWPELWPQIRGIPVLRSTHKVANQAALAVQMENLQLLYLLKAFMETTGLTFKTTSV